MKNLVFITCLVLLFSCSNKTQSTEEAATEEVAEEAMEEVAEEAAEEEVTISEDYYDLKELDCKVGESFNLKNIYQLTPHEVDQIDQEPSFYGSILNLRYRFDQAVRMCLDQNDWSADQYDRLLNPKIQETGKRGRTDLFPTVEHEMYMVPAWLPSVVSNKLIPNPNSSQYNGVVYQRIYDYYRNEFRKLHLAYLLLNSYSSFEYEMRLYANAAQRGRFLSDGKVQFSDNYDSYYQFWSRYMEPYWSKFESVSINSNMHHYSAFWLRRGLDESAEELNSLQEKIINLYDPEWKNELNEYFGKPLPKITFDTTDYVDFIDGGQIIIETDSIEQFYEQAENGILIKFDNGNSRFYEQGDYAGFYINSYLPESNALIITQESEYPESFYLSLDNGEQMQIGGAVTDHYISPDGNFIIAKYADFETSGMLIYQLTDDMAKLIFNSGYIKTPGTPRWLTDSKFVLPLEMDGQLVFDLTIF